MVGFGLGLAWEGEGKGTMLLLCFVVVGSIEGGFEN